MVHTPAHKGLLLEPPGGEKRVLLHACCAPCSSAILEIMVRQGIRPTVFYSNSNIFPLEEYLRRKDECTRYAQSLGLETVDDDYSHEDWRCSAAHGLENEPERGARCLACFKYRLHRAALYASEHGFPVLATTLASSRWKDLDQVNEAGRAACAAVNSALATAIPGPGLPIPVTWWDRNWRKGGLQERRNQLIRELGFYNQQYCGCEYSLRGQ